MSKIQNTNKFQYRILKFKFLSIKSLKIVIYLGFVNWRLLFHQSQYNKKLSLVKVETEES